MSHDGRLRVVLLAGAALALLGAKCSLFNKAPAVPVVTGPAQGVAGVPVTFKATATDPDGDSIAFQFDWGDTTTPAWSAFLASGETLSAAHTYADSGNYTVKARAKDRGGKESGWSVGQALQLVGSGPGYPDSIVGEIWLPWSLFHSEMSRDGSLLGLGPSDAESLLVIRTLDRAIIARVRVGSSVGSVAFSSDNRYAYAGSYRGGMVTRVDVQAGCSLAAAALGVYPRSMAVAAGDSLVFVGGGAAVRVLRASSLEAVDSALTPSEVRWLVRDQAGATLYLSMDTGIGVVSTTACSLVAFRPTQTYPGRIALSPDGSLLYVANLPDSGISALSTADLSTVRTLALSCPAIGDIDVSPDGTTLYVYVPGGICFVDTRTMDVRDSLALYSGGDIFAHPAGDTVYVTSGRWLYVIGR